MSAYFDTLETRSADERETALMAALPALIGRAKSQSSYYAVTLAGVEAAAVTSRAALARLPVVRKHQLLELQRQTPPFGGLNTTPMAGLAHVFSSPGPIADPEGRGEDWWRWARAMHAAGIRAGDLVHNTFSYHFTPAGFMVDGGARRLGCPVFPAGVGQTEMQVQAIESFRPAAYVGTPSFLKIILEKAAELGTNASSLKRAIVSGEALFPAQKQFFVERGLTVFQTYASADVGMMAYETGAHEGLMLEESLILELVRPGTGDPVADGEVGEVVITSTNPDYPLIRFGTGDLSAILPGVSPCGRTNMRIKGWLGRADQTTKVKGMFVHPEQIEAVRRRHGEISRARLVVTSADGNDRMTLHCEVREGVGDETLARAVAESIRDVTKLRGEVVFAIPGGLANDGKVIEDARKYD